MSVHGQRGLVVYQDPNEDKRDAWLRYINYRVYTMHQNFMCGITGPTGSGKTYFGLYCAEKLAKQTGATFNINHVVFTLLEFYKLLDSFKGKIPPGTIILFDEPQTAINARDWQSQANKAMNRLVSTFRHNRCIVFFCMPYMRMLDKNTRTLFHAEFNMQRINKTDKIAICCPRTLHYDESVDRTYKKTLFMWHKEHGKTGMTTSRIDFWGVPLASKELIDAYEQKKTAFTNELKRRDMLELLNADLKERKKQEKIIKESEKLLIDEEKQKENPDI